MKSHQRFYLILLVFFAVSVVNARTWKSADGTQSFEGELRSYERESGVVEVLIGGNLIKFHESKLSSSDRKYLLAVDELKAKPEGDLIGHWPFDIDGRDISGHERHAKMLGGSSIIAGNVGNGSLKVSQNQVAEIVHHPDFDLDHPFTISLWIYREPGAIKETWGPILTKGDGGWRIQANRKGESVAAHISSLQGLISTHNNSIPLDDGKWYHIRCVFTGKSLHLYVDGREVANKNRDAEIRPIKNEEPIRVGGNSIYPDRQFNGRIDDVRIYSREFTRGEIQRLMRVE